MVISTLLLFSSTLLNAKPAQVHADVFVGAHGPYRFLVDTGSETGLIDAKLAKLLQLLPRFRVEVIRKTVRAFYLV